MERIFLRGTSSQKVDGHDQGPAVRAFISGANAILNVVQELISATLHRVK